MKYFIRILLAAFLLSVLFACGEDNSASNQISQLCADCRFVPPIESITGLNGEQQINPDEGLTIHFTIPMDEVFLDIVSFYIEDGEGNQTAITFEWSEDRESLNVLLSQPLLEATDYALVAINTSSQNTESTAVKESFTTADITAPTIVSVLKNLPDTDLVQLKSTLDFEFSEAMNEDSLSENLKIIPDSNPGRFIAGSFNKLGDTNKYSFTPMSPLQPDTQYRVLLNAEITDLSGNPILASQKNIFTTVPTGKFILPLADRNSSGQFISDLQTNEYGDTMVLWAETASDGSEYLYAGVESGGEWRSIKLWKYNYDIDNNYEYYGSYSKGESIATYDRRFSFARWVEKEDGQFALTAVIYDGNGFKIHELYTSPLASLDLIKHTYSDGAGFMYIAKHSLVGERRFSSTWDVKLYATEYRAGEWGGTVELDLGGGTLFSRSTRFYGDKQSLTSIPNGYLLTYYTETNMFVKQYVDGGWLEAESIGFDYFDSASIPGKDNADDYLDREGASVVTTDSSIVIAWQYMIENKSHMFVSTFDGTHWSLRSFGTGLYNFRMTQGEGSVLLTWISQGDDEKWSIWAAEYRNAEWVNKKLDESDMSFTIYDLAVNDSTSSVLYLNRFSASVEDFGVKLAISSNGNWQSVEQLNEPLENAEYFNGSSANTASFFRLKLFGKNKVAAAWSENLYTSGDYSYRFNTAIWDGLSWKKTAHVESSGYFRPNSNSSPLLIDENKNLYLLYENKTAESSSYNKILGKRYINGQWSNPTEIFLGKYFAKSIRGGLSVAYKEAGELYLLEESQLKNIGFIEPPSGNVVAETSGNNSLQLLSVRGKTLASEFSSTVTEYSIELNAQDSNIVVLAKLEDRNASVYIDRINLLKERPRILPIVPIDSIGSTVVLQTIVDLKETINIPVGETVISINVIAENGDKKIYTITVNRPVPVSSDITLSALSLSGGGSSIVPDLMSGFAPSISSYLIKTPFSVNQLTLAAKATSIATITLIKDGVVLTESDNNIGIQLNPVVGLNSYIIRLTAEDGVTKGVYELDVVRLSEDYNNAALSELSVSGFVFSELFDPSQLLYQVSVGNNVSTIDISGAPVNTNSLIKVAGIPLATQGVFVKSLPIDVGSNNIVINVVAEDGVSEKKYILNVYRQTVIESTPSLSALQISRGVLSPVFSPDITEYTATVAYSITNVDVSASLPNNGAGVLTINDISESNVSVVLSASTHLITAKVASIDGVYARNYYITITRESADTFAQKAFLKASNFDNNDRFGKAIAFDGNTLVVGANMEDSSATAINGAEGNDVNDNGNFNAGAAYVFERAIDGSWTQTAYLKAFNSGKNDNFGGAVAINGNTIAIGARNEDTYGGINASYEVLPVEAASQNNSMKPENTGAVYLYEKNQSGEWQASGFISGIEHYELLGSSIAMDNKTLLIGAYAGVGEMGKVHRYTRNSITKAWEYKNKLKASDEVITNAFGRSLSLYGNRIVVSALKSLVASEPSEGAVYIFDCDALDVCTETVQLNHQPINVTGGYSANFGSSVSLGDGLLAIGASGDRSNLTGINPLIPATNDHLNANGSGAVYIYQLDALSGNWVQQAYIKAKYNLEYYKFGYRVLLDGNRLYVSDIDDRSATLGVNGVNESTTVSTGGNGAVHVYNLDVVSNAWSRSQFIKPPYYQNSSDFGNQIFIQNGLLMIADFSHFFDNPEGTGTAANYSGAVYIYEATVDTDAAQ